MRKPGQVDWQYKKALDEAGLSQRALGAICGINHCLLSMYARGRYNLDAAERHKIAKSLKMSESQVFTNWE
jgi:transcriptional regulator with XRE-family HTH domain